MRRFSGFHSVILCALVTLAFVVIVADGKPQVSTIIEQQTVLPTSSPPSPPSSSTTRGGFFAALQSIGNIFLSRTAVVSYVPLRTVFQTTTVTKVSSCYIPVNRVPASFFDVNDPEIRADGQAGEAKDDLGQIDASLSPIYDDLPEGSISPDAKDDVSNKDISTVLVAENDDSSSFTEQEVIDVKPIINVKARRVGKGFFGMLSRETSTVLVGIIRTKVYTETEKSSKVVVGAFRCDDSDTCPICEGYDDSNPFPELIKENDQDYQQQLRPTSTSSFLGALNEKNKPSGSQLTISGGSGNFSPVSLASGQQGSRPSASLPFVDRNSAGTSGNQQDGSYKPSLALGTSQIIGSTGVISGPPLKEPSLALSDDVVNSVSLVASGINQGGSISATLQEDPEDSEPVGQVELLYVQPEKPSSGSNLLLDEPSGGLSLKPPALAIEQSASYVSGSNFQPNLLKQSALAGVQTVPIQASVPERTRPVSPGGGPPFKSAVKPPPLIKPTLPEKPVVVAKNAQKSGLLENDSPITNPVVIPAAAAAAEMRDEIDEEEEEPPKQITPTQAIPIDQKPAVNPNQVPGTSEQAVETADDKDMKPVLILPKPVVPKPKKPTTGKKPVPATVSNPSKQSPFPRPSKLPPALIRPSSTGTETQNQKEGDEAKKQENPNKGKEESQADQPKEVNQDEGSPKNGQNKEDLQSPVSLPAAVALNKPLVEKEDKEETKAPMTDKTVSAGSLSKPKEDPQTSMKPKETVLGENLEETRTSNSEDPQKQGNQESKPSTGADIPAIGDVKDSANKDKEEKV